MPGPLSGEPANGSVTEPGAKVRAIGSVVRSRTLERHVLAALSELAGFRCRRGALAFGPEVRAAECAAAELDDEPVESAEATP
jgi:hypothetical protein